MAGMMLVISQTQTIAMHDGMSLTSRYGGTGTINFRGLKKEAQKLRESVAGAFPFPFHLASIAWLPASEKNRPSRFRTNTVQLFSSTYVSYPKYRGLLRPGSLTTPVQPGGRARERVWHAQGDFMPSLHMHPWNQGGSTNCSLSRQKRSVQEEFPVNASFSRYEELGIFRKTRMEDAARFRTISLLPTYISPTSPAAVINDRDQCALIRAPPVHSSHV
ncbi:hypothetical protein BDZ45DRAFT_784217 [Acephala macrosclerotiorum]|nr:hypothetical protein BDZ45DRAFT_784217 [Acephala macrosclerotiorum]